MYCHRFSSSGKYYAPKEGLYQSYIDYVRGLPLIPKPEVFGLHENADITKDNARNSAGNELLSFYFSYKMYVIIGNAALNFYIQSLILAQFFLFQLFDTILLTLPRQSGGGGKSSADAMLELAADILTKLPENFDMEMVIDKYPVILTYILLMRVAFSESLSTYTGSDQLSGREKHINVLSIRTSKFRKHDVSEIDCENVNKTLDKVILRTANYLLEKSE